MPRVIHQLPKTVVLRLRRKMQNSVPGRYLVFGYAQLRILHTKTQKTNKTKAVIAEGWLRLTQQCTGAWASSTASERGTVRKGWAWGSAPHRAHPAYLVCTEAPPTLALKPAATPLWLQQKENLFQLSLKLVQEDTGSTD